MLDYKWEKFAQTQHRIGATIHWTYVLVLIMYINFQYLEAKIDYKLKPGHDGKQLDDYERLPEEANPIYLWVLFGCLFYPLIYDGTQMLKQKGEYLLDPWNYIDMMHISLGYLNIYF